MGGFGGEPLSIGMGACLSCGKTVEYTALQEDCGDGIPCVVPDRAGAAKTDKSCAALAKAVEHGADAVLEEVCAAGFGSAWGPTVEDRKVLIARLCILHSAVDAILHPVLDVVDQGVACSVGAPGKEHSWEDISVA